LLLLWLLLQRLGCFFGGSVQVKVGWMMKKSVMDEKETNYWPTLLLLLLWIGLPERLQISYLPPPNPIRVFLY
jgi:hypothetical protein